MAIYRKGTASVDAAGKMTGTGTEWMQALSLIRIGATVIFLSGSKPVLGSIAEIISDTEMNLIGTDGQAATSGEYVILLSDSLTVDGLAQDIAETLRYYQGKESAIDGLIDSIEAYLKRAEDSADAAEASSQSSSESASEASRQVVLAAEQVGLAADQVSAAKVQADSAASSADSAQQSASAAKTSETNAAQKATDAAASASAAKTSETNAAQKASDAAASAAAAKTSETNAAATISVAALKSQNLNDLADKASGWTNLLTARSAVTARSDLGLGNSSTRNVGSASGTVAAGDDSRIVNAVQPNTNPFLLALELSSDTPYIDFHFNSTTENYDTRLINSSPGNLDILAGGGNANLRVYGGYRCRTGTAGSFGNAFNYNWNSGSQMEVWVDASRVGAMSLVAVSDRGLKKDIVYQQDDNNALDEVMQWRPATFKMKERGIMPESKEILGFIANDIKDISPQCVEGKGLPDDYSAEDDPNNPDAFYLNDVSMIAKLTQAIHAQQKMIENLTSELNELKGE
ncbi:tail fiber protein [Pantoea phage vB_PagS_AAS23]|uniref:Tail fiber protein n=1 Tax=Pantoea phage vB_PagS_AAS23 TaxID=2499073 RepID=A0A3S9U7N8_9CAUD|nr:tail fiber protein [Pantoea phage vB_PagS_AAS23]AZS06337.1 tail fiber protein [Pantoea phage vB_PagS_AAS23]